MEEGKRNQAQKRLRKGKNKPQRRKKVYDMRLSLEKRT